MSDEWRRPARRSSQGSNATPSGTVVRRTPLHCVQLRACPREGGKMFPAVLLVPRRGLTTARGRILRYCKGDRLISATSAVESGSFPFVNSVVVIVVVNERFSLSQFFPREKYKQNRNHGEGKRVSCTEDEQRHPRVIRRTYKSDRKTTVSTARRMSERHEMLNGR